MKKTLCLIFSALATASASAALSVDRLIVRQNWPWDPSVKATFTLSGETDRNADVQLVVSGGEDVYEIPFAELAGDVRSVSAAREWTLVWNPAENGTVPYGWLDANRERLAFSLKLTPVNPKYLVVDLSGGVTADSYPVSALAERPACGWGDEHKTDKLVLRHIRVYGGTTFSVGSPNDEWGHPLRSDGVYSAENQVTVSLTNDYYMAIFELTQKQHELLTGVTAENPTFPSSAPSWASLRGKLGWTNEYNTTASKKASLYQQAWPYTARVEEGSIVDVLMKKTDWSGFLPSGWRLDLPTETQWEYACRAGSTGPWGNGKDFDFYTDGNGKKRDRSADDMAWHAFNNGGVTHPVGLKRPNAWDLYDMHGGLSERCIDVHLGGSSVSGGTVEPRGNDLWDGGYAAYRVLRGGDASMSSMNITEYSARTVNYVGTVAMLRSAVRGRYTSVSGTSATVGVRLALWYVKGSKD